MRLRPFTRLRALRITALALFTGILLSWSAIAPAQTAATNYSGLWWNPAQNGMGAFMNQQSSVSATGVKTEILFGMWFLYGADGKTAWLSFTCSPLMKDAQGRDGCTAPLARATGSQPMNYDPTKFVVSSPGTMTIAFNTASSATVTYSFEGQTGTLNWVPQIFGNDGNANSLAAAQYGKLWWNPAQNGMGSFMNQQSFVNAGGVKTEILFGMWFLYGVDGKTTWLSFTCSPLVKDAQGRDGCTAPLARATGALPMNYDPTRFVVTSPGTVTVAFNSTASATVTYGFEGQTGTLNWVPQIFGNVLSYTEKVIAIKGGYPFMVTKTGTVKVVNKTQYQAGFLPLSRCDIGSPQLTDGKVLTRCTNAVATASTPANSRVISYINSVTGEQFDYTGTVPANLVWQSVTNNADKPEWGAKTRVSDGWFFTPFNATSNLKFQADTGVITNIENVGDGIDYMFTFTS